MEQQQFGEVHGGTNQRRQIPYDYSFVYQLMDHDDPSKSLLNETQSQTVTVSIEAPFTAVSISYALLVPDAVIRFGPGETSDLETIETAAARVYRLDQKGDPLLSRVASTERTSIDSDGSTALINPVPPIAPRALMIGDILNSLARKIDEATSSGEIGPRAAQVLLNGIKLSPEAAKRLFLSGGKEVFDAEDLDELFQPVGVAPERIQFTYSLHDEGSGRAFQSEPIFNLSGLGIANEDRPFRYFGVPITFMPRTTIRLDVTPKSDFRGELHVVLHGYKVLGAQGTPTGRAAKRRRLSQR